MKRILLSGVALVLLPGAVLANCPNITVADMQGVSAGAYPNQLNCRNFRAPPLVR